MVVLKPNQIHLMNQLEFNRSQLNPDQLQTLNYLKSQYAIMQSQQYQQSQAAQFQAQQQQPVAQKTDHSMASLLAGDQLPVDLENVLPITMMHDDMLQDTDLNSLLSRTDIVEDLRTSDGDKGSLDHVLASHTTRKINPANLSFATEHIKLDSSLTNGSNDTSNANLIPMSDEDLLAAKLNIGMSSEQVLNACKSYGLNGIQSSCILKPGRLRRDMLLRYANEKELLEENTNRVIIKKIFIILF